MSISALRHREPPGPAGSPTPVVLEVVAAPATGARRRLDLGAVETGARAVALVVGTLAVAIAYRESLVRERVVHGVHFAGAPVEDPTAAGWRAAAVAHAQQGLDATIVLVGGAAEARTTARALGSAGDPEPVVARALAIGRSGDVVDDLHARQQARAGRLDLPPVFSFDEARALATLGELAPALSRPSRPTRFSFDDRAVLPPERGSRVVPHDALSAVAVGLAAGELRIELPTLASAAVADPLAAIPGLDLSQRLAAFETRYSTDPSQAQRADNLRSGAAALDGTVIGPGAEFSFNEVVGPRSVESGFRFAPGITGGEMVDVVGGGICQVSSTLFGAAFFAGLDLLEHRPHSRPSAYVDMGLDSTVVYPDLDLRLRNPYEFPIVIHLSVQHGVVRAEILGKARPLQVAFERDLIEVAPHRTVVRDDPGLRLGTEHVVQRGLRGFKLRRTRTLLRAGEVVRVETHELSYPPTTEIVARGSDPKGELPPPSPAAPVRDPVPHLRIVQ